ncbi:MAG: hypothetical protein OXU81_05475 [Gammaproteobacteria bacterium]|nr:hypothetical protein [Gammaproteobacteria bacterium]
MDLVHAIKVHARHRGPDPVPSDEWRRLVAKVQIPFLIVVVASVALAFGTLASWVVATGTGFALWIAVGVVLGVRDRLRHRRGGSMRRLLGFGFMGMTLTDLGAGSSSPVSPGPPARASSATYGMLPIGPRSVSPAVCLRP